MGGCLSKGKEDAGAEKSKNSPKSSTKSSTISASETEERAIRVQREDKKGITTTAPSKIPRIVTPSTKPNLETKPQAEAQAAKTAPARTLESKSSIPVRSLTPTPPPRVVSVQLSTPSPPPQAELRAPSPLPERRTPSPLPERRTPSPSQSKVPVPAQTGERRTGTTPPPSTNGAAVPENRRSSIPLPQTKVVLPERMISGLSMAVSTAEVPERKVSPVGSLKLERKPSAAESLKLERKISPLERTIAATPPPPAPTPPPCAPTPPPMPPTPPPARGSMSTISEDSGTISLQARGPLRHGTFGYTFRGPSPPPFGHSRPVSPEGPTPDINALMPSRESFLGGPKDALFGYTPVSAPISRSPSPPLEMASPLGEKIFGYTSSSAPITRSSSPAQGKPTPLDDGNYGYRSSSPPIGGGLSRSPTRTTFGYKAVVDGAKRHSGLSDE